MESPLSFNSSENFRKKLLLRNLKPYRVEGFYNSNDSAQNKEIIIFDYSVSDVETVDVTANLLEPKLIGLNKYTPIDGNFGELVQINQNLGTQTNFGNYTYRQSEGSFLEIFGKRTEKELLVQNQFTKDVGQAITTVTINSNKQTKANEGPFKYEASSPNLTSLQSQTNAYTINAYGPENGNNGYGNSVLFPIKIIGSNFGEYDYVSNGPEITTEQSQVNAYTSNFFGPQGGFGDVVVPNINKQTKPNSGPFSYVTSLPNRTIEQSRKIAFLSNIFGPEDNPDGYSSTPVDPNLNFQTRVNEGEFNYETSSPNLTTQQSQTFLYSKNKYNNGDGSFEVLTIDDIAFENINEPYYNSDTTFSFIPSDYSPANILSTEDLNSINGSEGSLSQDSDLAKLAAKQLQKEFKARVAFELFQQTLGKTNLSNTTVNQNSGGISAELTIDPFSTLGVITNNIPLIQRDFKITQLPTLVGSALSFVSKVSGLYSPYSTIPGEYFDYPQKNILSQALSNPIGAVAGQVSNLATKILTPNIDSGSETLLLNTSSAVKSIMFDMLFYNEYRPNYKFGSALSPNLSAPNGNFYIGNNSNYIKNLVSPITDLPKDNKGNPVVGPVYGYGRLGKDYEGNGVNQKLFGLNTRPFYDKVGIQGGFTWIAKKNYLDPGRFVGPANEKGILVPEDVDSTFSSGFKTTFDKTVSSNITFTPNSILDVTQRLVEAGSAGSSSKLEHVGNAINQISKVFNDGYQEITKGSKARRYVTPTSKDSNVKDIVGYEYCRLFTKDRPYISYSQLQKKDGNIRKYNSSVLDNTYNLNIAPMGGVDSTNLQVIDGKLRAKKYMFSIENLAWRTSSRVGYRVEDLPACEIGPNGGRIMWFPPYDLNFDDNSQTTWQDNVFLGRPEPVYTYSKTSRKGTITFKIIVDHPSVLNVLVNKELEKTEESLATKVIDSFFAGCLKYDLVDLLKKYPMFSFSDIYETVETLRTIEEIKEVQKELPPTETDGESVEKSGGDNLESDTTTSSDVSGVIKELEDNKNAGGKYEEMILMFPDDIPKGTTSTSDSTYGTYNQELLSLQSTYVGLVTYDGVPDGYFINYKTKVKKQEVNEDGPNFMKEWIIAKPSRTNSLFEKVSSEYSDFKEMLDKVAQVLDSGGSVELDVISSASSKGNPDYNKTLSQRRADSVIKEIYQKEINGKKLEEFTKTDETEKVKLKINKKEEGSDSDLKSIDFKDVDCRERFSSTSKDGIGSMQAMLCRRVTVSLVNITDPETKPEKEKGQEEKGKNIEGDFNSTGAEIGSNNTETQATQNPDISYTTVKDKTTRLRGDLTKRLLRKLLTECNYFEMIKEQNPMVYDGIKSKIKNFQPIFHSITPEGLNSRLTFLNQCMRPGDTIPTAVEAGGQTQFQYNDVFNSAFGTPPVCVLRVGDFYHSKIIIDQMSFKYENAKFDINPEGIGVQPMIADVTMNFNFIGGHGIDNPVSELQNALSFNYYANTEMYDDRATITEDAFGKFNSEVLDEIGNLVGIVQPSDKPKGTGAGNTIGIIKSTSGDPQTSTVTGTIEYKTKMNEVVNIAGSYMNTIYSNLFSINEQTNLGGLLMYTKDRKYNKGLFNDLGSSPQNVETNIIGKPINYDLKVNSLISKAEEDLENGLNPIFANIENQNFKNSDIRKVKNKFKSMIRNKNQELINAFEESQTNIITEQLKMVNLIDQMNFILSKRDGYETKKKSIILYQISGLTEGVDQSESYSNTYDELKGDFIKIANQLNDYQNKLAELGIVPTDEKYIYKDDFKTQLFLKDNEDETPNPHDNVIYQLFGKEILKDVDKFVTEIILPIDESKRFQWKYFIYGNLGFTQNVSFIAGVPSAGFVQKSNGLIVDFKRSNDKMKDAFEKFLKYKDEILPNAKYNPFNPDKKRILSYEKQLNLVDSDVNNFRNLWSTVDSIGNKFNLKKKMN